MQDVITNTIAILALVASMASIYFQNKVSKASLESDFFIKTFQNFLIEDIPDSVEILRFDESGLLTDFDQLSTNLTKLKKKILYFKYRDNRFYGQLKNKIDEIDDFVIILYSKKRDKNQQDEDMEKLNQKIKELYSVMFSYYFGKTGKTNRIMNEIKNLKKCNVPLIYVIIIIFLVVLCVKVLPRYFY